mmetsp:Transcript_29408/g.70956  ORF Transcript_29408/g.70956 Transcript_29408/m.70956 type:complete len:1264 (-) Transcript_29408:35-3826(-)
MIETKKTETETADHGNDNNESDVHSNVVLLQRQNNEKDSSSKIRKRTEFITPPPPSSSSETAMKTRNVDFESNTYDDNNNDNNDPIRYYRIVYRGVVALSKEPPPTEPSISSDGPESSPAEDIGNSSNKKSGVYLSYGEIVASRQEISVEVDEDENDNYNDSSTDAYSVSRGTASSTTGPNDNNNNNYYPTTPQRSRPSPRLGSAVSSPILSDVWERQQQQQQQEQPIIAPSSPTRSGVSPIGTGNTNTYAVGNNLTCNEDGGDEGSGLSTSNRTRIRRRMIRIDQILTGGYAKDATDVNGNPIGTQIVNDFANTSTKFNVDVKAYEKTPKRGNVTHSMLLAVSKDAPSMMTMMGPSGSLPPGYGDDQYHANTSLGHASLTSDEKYGNGREYYGSRRHGHGYIFLEQGHLPIAVPIESKEMPECERGKFLYRVVSSTPLLILTGPCEDAPKTKGILIPGSVHEVCLEVGSDDDGGRRRTFLRLTRRRGWVLSGKWSMTSKGNYNDKNGVGSKPTPGRQWVTAMKKLPPHDESDMTSVATRVSTTTVSSAIATPFSAARRRHRPPRRKQRERMTKDGIDAPSLPRHVMGPPVAPRNDTSILTDTSMTLSNTSVQQLNTDPSAIVSPASNISLLSDESSLEQQQVQQRTVHSGGVQPSTPDRSVARSTASSSSTCPSFFLMRVNAPRGLKILDAPHFQVNNLIHGSHGTIPATSASFGGGSHNHSVHSTISPLKDTANQSIFQTMTGHNHTTTMTSKIGNPAVFDPVTKARRLPRGAIFEASKRMEPGAYSQNGLLKLSDNSGWAIVPTQQQLDEQYRNYSGALAHTREGEATRAYEEVGNALPDDHSRQAPPLFLRVLSKGGLSVSLPPVPSTESDVETSPTSSTTGSSAVSGLTGVATGGGHIQDNNSDVASSVASSFLDAFRTPRKHRDRDSSGTEGERRKDLNHHNQKSKLPMGDRSAVSTVIPCGICVEVDRWVDPLDTEHHAIKIEYARLRGGQGWIPRFVNGRPVVETVAPPEVRFGSFWFRVQDRRGIKVRLGPSRRAPSIKSDDGVYFRFECGEFLRASEVVTFFRRNSSIDCFAKLYRNRHIRLQAGIQGEVRSLVSLTTQAEWVQVFGDGSLFLDECATEPRIERHRQGWRYNVVLDARVPVRKGPSFAAETDGVVLLGGESVLVNERVTGPNETTTWLRLKDGMGWVHTVGQNGEMLMIAHSLRHRVTDRPSKSGRNSSGQDDIAYNTIVARLFNNDVPGESPRQVLSRRSGR